MPNALVVRIRAAASVGAACGRFDFDRSFVRDSNFDHSTTSTSINAVQII